jgi:L-iditol 2-dehydrogenase
MKATVLYGINDLRYETDYPLPVLKDGEVLVKVRAAGICGSDVARVLKNGTYHFPTIIGHEFSGEVCAVKDETDNKLIGKRVSVFPLKPCFECDNCKQGRYEMCEHYDYLGSRCDGGFAEFVAVPKWNLCFLPDNISFESAAMFEPSAVAMHALLRSGLQVGDDIAIIGPGTIGIILCQLARIAGAGRVFLIGRSNDKLNFAQQMGVGYVFNSSEGDAVEWIMQNTNNKGVDVALEGTGASASFELCLNIAKASGTLLAMGNPLSDMSVSQKAYWKLLRKQLTVVGTWNSSFGVGKSDWQRILDLLAAGNLQLEKLITHRLALPDLYDGIKMMADKNVYTNKVMIING